MSRAAVTTWTEVDEPLLRWLFEREDEEDWNGRIEQLILRPDPVRHVGFGRELDSRQIDDGLQRLVGHRLIEGSRVETIAYAHWTQLRLRGEGLVLLGEWPDLERVAGAAGIQTLLAVVSEQTENADDRSALRQAAGAIGRIGEGIVEQTISTAGTDLASDL